MSATPNPVPACRLRRQGEEQTPCLEPACFVTLAANRAGAYAGIPFCACHLPPEWQKGVEYDVPPKPPEEKWAVVELMGHVRYGGRITKDTEFGTPLLRVDVPQPDGAFVTQFVNPSSLYRLTICTEELARLAAGGGQHSPIQPWELAALPSVDQNPDIEHERY